jgi:hypothetical protein
MMSPTRKTLLGTTLLTLTLLTTSTFARSPQQVLQEAFRHEASGHSNDALAAAGKVIREASDPYLVQQARDVRSRVLLGQGETHLARKNASSGNHIPVQPVSTPRQRTVDPYQVYYQSPTQAPGTIEIVLEPGVTVAQPQMQPTIQVVPQAEYVQVIQVGPNQYIRLVSQPTTTVQQVIAVPAELTYTITIN